LPESRHTPSASVTVVTVDVQEGTGPEAKADKGHRTSLATRLAVVVLLISISAILVAVLVSADSVGASADEIIEQRVATRMNATASELNAYFDAAQADVGVLVASPSVATALTEFARTYDELDALGLDAVADEADRLFQFYAESFIPALDAVRGKRVDPDELIPQEEPAPVYLQAAYIADSPVGPIDRRLITDPGDGSSWTEVHKVYHPSLRQRVESLGFDDLFLIDAGSKSVVYSTDKDVAFGTNLVAGPHSGTPLAALVRRVLNEGEKGLVYAADVGTYTPLLDLPSGFLASRVFDGDQLLGVLAVSIDLDDVTGILTQDWRDGRFGETGEAYLVASDKTMRSDSRSFIENPTAYLLRIDALGDVAAQDRRHMEVLDTTVVFQRVDNESVRDGLEGQTGVAQTTNYLGEDVYSAHTPVARDVFDWVLMVEQAVSEAEASFSDYIQSILTVTVVFVVGLTFVAVWWAGRLVAPLRGMSAALRSTREDEIVTPVPMIGVTEFRELASHLNQMADSLVARKEAVLGALRGKTAVLRTLVPASAIAHMTVGDHQFVETVPQVSVAVVRLDGIDALFSGGDIDENRTFLTSLIQAADEIAKANDLERVKVTGATYYAVSGMDTPHLDHAPRSVRFAAETIRAMAAIAEDSGIELSVSAGVSAGTVTAGLVGDGGLVFDLWGQPVDEAGQLAYRSPASTIYVSAAVRQRLPGGTGLAEVALPHDESAWSLSAEEAMSEGAS